MWERRLNIFAVINFDEIKFPFPLKLIRNVIYLNCCLLFVTDLIMI